MSTSWLKLEVQYLRYNNWERIFILRQNGANQTLRSLESQKSSIYYNTNKETLTLKYKDYNIDQRISSLLHKT